MLRVLISKHGMFLQALEEYPEAKKVLESQGRDR